MNGNDTQPQKVTANDIATKLNRLEAMRRIVTGWNTVTRSTIVNCWWNSSFEADDVRLEDEVEVAPPPEMTNERFNAWFDVDRDVQRESESLSMTLSIVNEDVVIDGDDDDDDDLEDTTRNHVLCHR